MGMANYYVMKRIVNSTLDLVCTINNKLSQIVYAKSTRNLKFRMLYVGG